MAQHALYNILSIQSLDIFIEYRMNRLMNIVIVPSPRDEPCLRPPSPTRRLHYDSLSSTSSTFFCKLPPLLPPTRFFSPLLSLLPSLPAAFSSLLSEIMPNLASFWTLRILRR